MKLNETNVGGVWDGKVLVLDIAEKVSKNGNAFCNITVKPKDNPPCTARRWNCTKADVEACTPINSIALVSLRVDEYHGTKTYLIERMEFCVCDDAVSEYVETADVAVNDAIEWMKECVAETGNENLSHVCNDLIDENREALQYYPAALKVHGAYVGGLVEHLGRVTSIAKGASMVHKLLHKQKYLEWSPEQALQNVETFLENHPGTHCTKALHIYQNLHQKLHQYFGSAKADKTLLTRVCMDISLVKGMGEMYDGLDMDLVYAACALRVLGYTNPLGQYVGRGPAACELVKKAYSKEEEKQWMAMQHCLLVGDDGHISAATSEGYLSGHVSAITETVCKAAETEFRSDVLLCAAAIHDIGKIRELEADETGPHAFALEGSLYGHTAMGISMCIDSAKRLNVPISAMTGVLSCIASHHGKLEWGAFHVPYTVEEEVLHLADMMDSRMNQYVRLLAQMNPGDKDDSAKIYLGTPVIKL